MAARPGPARTTGVTWATWEPRLTEDGVELDISPTDTPELIQAKTRVALLKAQIAILAAAPIVEVEGFEDIDKDGRGLPAPPIPMEQAQLVPPLRAPAPVLSKPRGSGRSVKRRRRVFAAPDPAKDAFDFAAQGLTAGPHGQGLAVVDLTKPPPPALQSASYMESGPIYSGQVMGLKDDGSPYHPLHGLHVTRELPEHLRGDASGPDQDEDAPPPGMIAAPAVKAPPLGFKSKPTRSAVRVKAETAPASATAAAAAWPSASGSASSYSAALPLPGASSSAARALSLPGDDERAPLSHPSLGSPSLVAPVAPGAPSQAGSIGSGNWSLLERQAPSRLSQMSLTDSLVGGAPLGLPAMGSGSTGGSVTGGLSAAGYDGGGGGPRTGSVEPRFGVEAAEGLSDAGDVVALEGAGERAADVFELEAARQAP